MTSRERAEIRAAAEHIKSGMLSGNIKYLDADYYLDILKILSLVVKENKNVSNK